MKKLFTLIELLVVIVILGILATIVIPNISNWQKEANQTAVVSNVRNLQTSVDMYATKNEGDLPGSTTPTVLNPSPIDFKKIHPKHLRNLPKTPKIKYWVDFTGKVWASNVDSPVINLKEDASNSNKVIVEWKTVEGAERYNIYKIENYDGKEGMITSSLSNSKMSLVKVGSISSTAYNEGTKNIAYLVSSVDKEGFESPPSGVGYMGYKEPFVENSDSPNVPAKPTSFSNELLGKTISLPSDSLRTELNLLVDGTGTTYAFFLKQNDIIMYTIDSSGKLSGEIKVTSQLKEKNRLQVKLVGDYFYATNVGTDGTPRFHKIEKDGKLVNTKVIFDPNVKRFGFSVNPLTGDTYSINDRQYTSSMNEVALSQNGTSKRIDSTGYYYSYGFDITVDNQGNVFTLHGRQTSNVSNDRLVFGKYDKSLNSLKGNSLLMRVNEVSKTDTFVDKNNTVYFLVATSNVTTIYKMSDGQEPISVAGSTTSKGEMMPTEDGIGFYYISTVSTFNSTNVTVRKFDGATLQSPKTLTQMSSFADANTDQKGNIVASRFSDGREIIYIAK